MKEEQIPDLVHCIFSEFSRVKTYKPLEGEKVQVEVIFREVLANDRNMLFQEILKNFLVDDCSKHV